MTPVGPVDRVRAAAGTAFFALPEAVRVRMPARNGYRADDVPSPVRVPDAPTRLYIAPANSAGQGWQWARAAARLDGVAAVNMQVRRPRDFGYPADYNVHSGVVAHSRRWGRDQYAVVAEGFTHVMAESHVALFGTRFRGDALRERRALADAGVRVAALSHGSDIRLPSRHLEHERWSPFHDSDFDLTHVLEAQTTRRAAMLDEIDGVEFVSTPDLLLDRPNATWLPVVVDGERWARTEEPLERTVPIVLHAPSAAGLKGTALIEDGLADAARRGEIDLRTPTRTPAQAMPDLVRGADIVLDQFSLGIYGAAAVEAMATGRLVVSHVSDYVRDTVRRETGWDLPIVEATADSLIDVLDDIRAHTDRYREIAARGPLFVSEVHDGRRSAAALAPFLGVTLPKGRIDPW